MKVDEYYSINSSEWQQYKRSWKPECKKFKAAFHVRSRTPHFVRQIQVCLTPIKNGETQ